MDSLNAGMHNVIEVWEQEQNGAYLILGIFQFSKSVLTHWIYDISSIKGAHKDLGWKYMIRSIASFH